jgi:DNA-binding response OmpR family regulator
VLVVEDDAPMAAGIVQGLQRHGFEVELSTHGDEVAQRVLAQRYDAMVLDLMLPGASGFAILGQLKNRLRIPIVVLTARTELDDRLKSFELGAADFIAKPFWIEELVARLRARLPTAGAAPPARVVRFGQAEVDLDGAIVRVGGTELPFTRTELAILAYLVQRPGRAVAREELAEEVLPSLDDVSGRTVDAHIARIRKKLGDDAKHLHTVWGIGYRFTREDGPDESD